jgi:hypothetical protein
MKYSKNMALAVIAGLSVSGSCLAGEDIDKKIAHARAAAPAFISADATIVVSGKVVVEGSDGMWGDTPYAHIMVPVADLE